MEEIRIEKELLTKETTLQEREEKAAVLLMPAKGGGISLPVQKCIGSRYLYFFLEALEEHSVSLNLLVYEKGEEEPTFTLRFGILPGVKTPICIDTGWLDAHVLFPEGNPGALKFVCHGKRVEKENIERIELKTLPAFHDVTIKISDFVLTDEFPKLPPLSDEKLVDELGQNKRKNWKEKIPNLDALKAVLEKQVAESEEGYPFEDWSIYGGWKQKKLGEGTGYFTKYKADGRWWLADPLGYAFFSMGPDCVNLGTDCRVDGVEKWMDWLPDENDQIYGKMYRRLGERPGREAAPRKGLVFSFLQANLYRGLGEDWYAIWKKMILGQLKRYGMNTLGNWSDSRLFENAEVPYVTSLPEFPSTKKYIFRDFPDVLSPEYQENAKRCAQALEKNKQDKLMIGYFLRNEPSWAFVDNLVLADEVLYNPERTACREELITYLKKKYVDIAALSEAWKHSFSGFEDLYLSWKNVSTWSEAAKEDMKEFSRKLLRAYVEIPCQECRKVDPNHMILGMRWAWISDPDLVTGWENFDVFSINCYSVDPTSYIQRIEELGVDLPVMIGEFHFGALDNGPTATGLEGVKTQKDRGIAYKHYCERVAAHPFGVGCHYFQCYDQFVLGRFDGENYNIGLFDICLQPYPDMLQKVKECSEEIYLVMDKSQEPTEEKPESIPMIAY